MTNRQAIEVELGSLPVDAAAIDKAFILDGTIEADGLFVKENAAAIEAILGNVLKGLLLLADITEGGYSIKYDRAAIQKRIDGLTSSGEPTVRAVNVW